MGLSRRTFTKEFKLAAVRRLEAGVSMAEVARGLEVSPSVLQHWRHEFRQAPGNAFPGNGQRRWCEGRVAELERKIGQQAVEIDFEGVLAAHRRTADAAGVDWKSAVYGKIGEEVSAGRRLTIERMVKLGRVSRASFYRFGEDAKTGLDPDMDLRDAIQRIALEWPSYGRPRITRELRRRGWTVNPKRVYRLLREDNLLCARKRKFVVTTNSNHGLRVYPNLAAGMVLTGVDQLWRADITYIRLREEFVFLAVILDAFSRRVIGWALDRTMEEELTLTALRMALKHRNVLPGLVHHSDRGSQYASNDYTDLLKASGIQISMSRKANPWDNAQCESFMKTLKYEEVLRNEYRDLAEAHGAIREFIEKVYNQRRLHSALGYLPPVEFEAQLIAQSMEAAARQLVA